MRRLEFGRVNLSVSESVTERGENLRRYRVQK